RSRTTTGSRSRSSPLQRGRLVIEAEGHDALDRLHTRASASTGPPRDRGGRLARVPPIPASPPASTGPPRDRGGRFGALARDRRPCGRASTGPPRDRGGRPPPRGAPFGGLRSLQRGRLVI